MPPAVAAAMLECDVFIAPTTVRLPYRGSPPRACANGARAATMPEITEDMLLRTMGADFEQVRRLSGALAKALTMQ